MRDLTSRTLAIFQSPIAGHQIRLGVSLVQLIHIVTRFKQKVKGGTNQVPPSTLLPPSGPPRAVLRKAEHSDTAVNRYSSGCDHGIIDDLHIQYTLVYFPHRPEVALEFGKSSR